RRATARRRRRAAALGEPPGRGLTMGGPTSGTLTVGDPASGAPTMGDPASGAPTMGDPASGAPSLTERVKGVARALGFDLVGVAPAEPGPRHAYLREWLARGYAGEMGFLARRADERADPRLVLPGARSAIVAALVYERGDAEAIADGGNANGVV